MSKTAKDRNDLAAFMNGAGDDEEETHLEATAVVALAPEPKPEVTEPTKRRTSKPQPEEQSKLGRRTFKKPGVDYVRFTVDLPEDTKELVDLARIKSGGPHKGKHQAVIVEEALRAYLKS